MSADSRFRERCVQQRQRISLRLDGELGHLGRLLLRAHLLRCGGCRATAARLQGLTLALRSTALAAPAPASVRRLRVGLQSQRLALVGGLAVLGLAVSMSGILRGGPVGQVGALSPVQGLPVYSTPYRLEGLPVYTRPSALLRTLAS